MMIFLILGILFLIYYFLCGSYGGFHLSMLFLWLAAGIVCLALAVVEFRFGGLPLPRGVKKGATVALLVVLAVFVTGEGMIVSGMGASGEPGLDYIVVLGAAVRGNRPTRALRHRIEKAAEYLEENPETVAIVSGGQGRGEELSEAACMKAELEKMGIASERIWMEDQSGDTEENIVNSFRMIDDPEARVGIVTNNFHVFRAVRIAKTLAGGRITGIAAPFRSVLLPHYMVREFFGLVWDGIQGNLF